MKVKDLFQRIINALSQETKSISAGEIAEAVGTRKTTVNRILYLFQGIYFSRNADIRPKWTVCRKKSRELELLLSIRAKLKKRSVETARSLAEQLGTDKSRINRYLYRFEGAFFNYDQGYGRPEWFLDEFYPLKWPLELKKVCAPSPKAPTKPPKPEPPKPSPPKLKRHLPPPLQAEEYLELFHAYNFYPRDWQLDAYIKWREGKDTGIVTAVTGAGKTALAIMAIMEIDHRCSESESIKILILVPTIDLQQQWIEEINKKFYDTYDLPDDYDGIGRRGGGKKHTFEDYTIIVSVVNSASTSNFGDVRQYSLIIADEVHRYSGTSHIKALKEDFSARLGLTATIDEEDDGYSKLLRYFNQVIYKYTFTEAKDDGIIAPFVVAKLGVDFNEGEQSDYDTQEKLYSESYKALMRHCPDSHRFPPNSFSKFQKWVNAQTNSKNSHLEKHSRLYLKAFSEKKSIIAGASNKMPALYYLVRAILESNGSIIFTDHKDIAERVYRILKGEGVPCGLITGDTPKDKRKRTLDDFKSGYSKAIIAPKVLDEGIDVPDADLGIILASSRSKRQMIQRMGRILRRKRGGAKARLVILYVKGTNEDPDQKLNTAFWDEILPVAESIKTFKYPEGIHGINKFLMK